MAKAPTSSQDRTPFAEKLPVFIEALEVLYIRNNLSGRQKFRALYPQAASHVFGEMLMLYDTQGGMDRAARTAEEDLADERRAELLHHISEIREKSVEGGVLQLRYIEGIMHELGPEISTDIFAPWVIDKIFPPAPKPEPVLEKPSPVEISEDFNAAPIQTPVIAKPASGFSPFTAGMKKKLVEFEMPKLSYKDLLARVEKLFSHKITSHFNRACGAR